MSYRHRLGIFNSNRTAHEIQEDPAHQFGSLDDGIIEGAPSARFLHLKALA